MPLFRSLILSCAVVVLTACVHSASRTTLGMSVELPQGWSFVPPSDIEKLVLLERKEVSRLMQNGITPEQYAKLSLALTAKNSVMLTWYGRAPDSLAQGQYVFIRRIPPMLPPNTAQEGFARAFNGICAQYINQSKQKSLRDPECSVTTINERPTLRASALQGPPRFPAPMMSENIMFPLRNGEIIFIIVVATPGSRLRINRDIDQLVKNMREP